MSNALTSDPQQLVHAVQETLASLEAADAAVRDRVKEGLTRGEKLRKAVRKVAESSSNSWAGWHSRMFYGDFEEPPVAETWDSEWGGIHGYSDRWRDRPQDEVERVIEERAGTTLADLAATADEVRETCTPLQHEVLTVLSPVCDLVGLEREAEMLSKLEGIRWITPPASYVQAMAPSQIMSRDSGAINQGLQPPLHLNVEAAIVSNTSTLATAREFLADSIRLSRQVRTKLAAAQRREHSPAPTVVPALSSTAERQLLVRSFVLFVLLGAAVAVGAYLGLHQVDSRLLTAVGVVCATLAIAGLYAWLIDRRHAVRALIIAAGVGGAIAAVDQLLAPLFE